VVLLGMGTDRGQVAAADHWDGEMQIKDVLPSRADSWEQQLLRVGIPASLTDWRGAERQALREMLAEPLLARAIGVIYGRRPNARAIIRRRCCPSSTTPTCGSNRPARSPLCPAAPPLATRTTPLLSESEDVRRRQHCRIA